jgi:Tfp pilus assembly protein PilO
MIADLRTGWRGRTLALFLLLVALAAAYFAVAVPLLDIYAAREARAASQRSLLAKLDTIVAGVPALRSRVGELRADADSHKLMLEGASDAIAAAALQGRIDRLAAAAGLTVGSTESLPVQTQGDYSRVGVRLLVSGAYASLIKLLAMSETATPPFVIDNLQIHGLMRRVGALTVLGLDASLEVSGFRPNQIAGVAKP